MKSSKWYMCDVSPHSRHSCHKLLVAIQTEISRSKNDMYKISEGASIILSVKM